ncbi:diacylglycerol kinase family protein [uncultured Lutibacter sp.]|uniref:diacylglycerol/lipid kinase family protein n=1 Tax=uncultured Lutibacter sp. TaxID=437739 RepID=UPI002628E8A0|nr:diacylglycerol kinase family protein [uncultured Lutibacter sp.]
MQKKWLVIVNPVAGNGAFKKKWSLIYNELIAQNFEVEVVFTEYKNHAVKIVQTSIKQGFTKFICVGGDGTLHSMVNGVLSLNPLNILEIKIGIIAIGTGNDWIKTYNISKDYKKAIQIIKTENTIKQDIGKITIAKNNETVYFNNLAGVGFDGYVVNKVHKFKNLGFLAYLTGALVSLTSYKKSELEIIFNNTILKGKCLMLLIGLCKFSGGGMQLTKDSNPTDGLFDISYVQKITLLTILSNIKGLFNGNITNHKLVNNYKASSLQIKVLDNTKTYIQADGELIGSNDFSVSILPKAVSFIVP